MEKRTIEECFYQIRNGANIKQGAIEGGFPITRIETVSNDKFHRDRMGYAGITDIGKYESYILEDGDLLMSHINSVQYLGRTVLYQKQGNETIIHGMNLLGLKANRNIINPAYARYYFYSPMFREQIRRITKKSVNQASFAVSDLKKLTILVPSLEEQVQVVEVLDKINMLIDLRQNELQKLDELVKSRFVELFESTELSDETTIEAVTKQVKVGFVGTCEKYYTDEAGVPMLRTGNITEKGIDLKDLKYVTREFHEKNKKSQIHTGDLLIARHGSNGQANVYSGPEAQCLNAVVIVPNQSIVSSIFLVGLINDPMVKEQIERTLVGSTQRVVNTKSIANLKVRIPSTTVQKQYEKFVKQIDKSKFVIQKAIDELQTLYDSLMQEYFG